MLVPAQWQGSVERFYHFFFGYFMPVVLWQEKTGARQFALRDCGPMNPWFSLLRADTTVDYLPPGVMLQRVLTHLQERVILRDWDNPTRFHRASLSRFADTVLARVGVDGRARELRDRIVVLDRRPGLDVFATGPAEVPGSGSDARSVPNMGAIAAALESLGEVHFVDAAELEPASQVRQIADARLIVAQHGAGLSNMTWLPRNAAVVEIQPPLPPIIDSIFANLAAALTLDHAVVPQASLHAEVPPDAVLAAARSVLEIPGTRVPRSPGRWPTRIRHQLPRRL